MTNSTHPPACDNAIDRRTFKRKTELHTCNSDGHVLQKQEFGPSNIAQCEVIKPLYDMNIAYVMQ